MTHLGFKLRLAQQLVIINPHQKSQRMPCLYKTEVRESPLQGKGVFALEDIPAGVVYWVWEETEQGVPMQGTQPRPNIALSKADFDQMSDPAEIKKVLSQCFTFAEGGLLLHLRDGTQMMNHSDDHNSLNIWGPQGDYRKTTAVTIRAIKAGEEISENYNGWLARQVPWISELMEKYNPEKLAFQDEVAKKPSPYYLKKVE